jgi:hypothetical protein
MNDPVIVALAVEHSLLISVCCGLVGRPCGKVYYAIPVAQRFAGLSHGWGWACCEDTARAEAAESIARLRAERTVAA